MATTKKYVSLEKLGLYDGKIKSVISTGDANTLQSAKDFASGLSSNYDASGSAATAKSEAIAHTDAEITKVNTAIDGVKTTAEKGVADAGVAKGAADTAQSAADQAQSDVDALKTYVGTFTTEDESVKTVVDYVDAKTSGIASDAQLTELANKVSQAEADIDGIQADYLKAADKTDLQGNIDAVDALVDTLISTDTGKSVRKIANEELAAQLIPETAKESLDTLTEIAAWIQDHPDDASEMNSKITTLEGIVDGIGGEGEKATVVTYVTDAVNTEKTRAEQKENELSGKIATLEGKFGGAEGSVEDMIADAEQSAKDYADGVASSEADAAESAAKTYADGLNTSMDARVEALEAIDHDHTNKTVLDGITAEKVSAWDASEGNAKTYADGLDSAMNTRVEALEAIDHSHSNKAELDLVKSGDVAKWDAATELINSFEECSESDINNLFA